MGKRLDARTAPAGPSHYKKVKRKFFRSGEAFGPFVETCTAVTHWASTRRRPARSRRPRQSDLCLCRLLGKCLPRKREAARVVNASDNDWGPPLFCRCSAHREHAVGEHAVSPTEVALFVPVALHAAKSDLHGSKCDIYLLMDWTLLMFLCPLLCNSAPSWVVGTDLIIRLLGCCFF